MKTFGQALASGAGGGGLLRILTPALAPTRVAPAAIIALTLEITHAARGFHAHLRADDPAHRRRRRPAPPGPKPVDVFVVGARGFRQRARRYLRRLSAALAMMTLLSAARAAQATTASMSFDDAEIAGLERADVDDRVDLTRRRRSRCVS
jgi:hypothetical protein